MQKLGIKAVFNKLIKEFLHVLHLDGLQDKLGTALQGDVGGAHGQVQSSHGNVLKISNVRIIIITRQP